MALSAAAVAAQQTHRLLETGGLSTETAALLMSGQEGGPVPIHALAVPSVAAAGAAAPMEVFVEADGAALLAGHQEDLLRLELCLYALAGSRVAASGLETAQLVPSQDREAMLAGGVRLHATLELAAGEYRLRVLVRNVQTGAVGLRTLAVSIPTAEEEADYLQLLVPAASDGGLRLSRRGLPSAIGFWPAARPALEPDRGTDMQAFVRAIEPGTARLTIRGESDTIEVPAAISLAEEAAPPGLARWLVRSHVPSLEPGVYRLRLRVGGVTSAELPAVVDPSEGQDRTGPAADADAVPPTGTASDRRRPSGRAVQALSKELETGYRASLTRLAAADFHGAVQALREAELAALEQPAGLEAIALAQRRTAAALADVEASSLAPLLELHFRAYERYVGEAQFGLSAHARNWLLELAELYLEEKPDDPQPAIDILVSLAGCLQRSQMERFSSVVFRRALQLDPDNEGALLGLAAGLEKQAAYRETVGALERLVAAHPENREAQLRLGVNLMRTESRAKARRVLTRLVALPQTDWILAVAYQELARDLLRRNRLEKARDLLGAARERLPEDDQLQLLRSVVADRQQDREAQSSARLVPRSRAGEPSARHRYQMWPQLRGDAESPARQPLEALAAALEGTRGEA